MASATTKDEPGLVLEAPAPVKVLAPEKAAGLVPLEEYPAGSDGPPAASTLIPAPRHGTSPASEEAEGATPRITSP